MSKLPPSEKMHQIRLKLSEHLYGLFDEMTKIEDLLREQEELATQVPEQAVDNSTLMKGLEKFGDGINKVYNTFAS